MIYYRTGAWQHGINLLNKRLYDVIFDTPSFVNLFAFLSLTAESLEDCEVEVEGQPVSGS